MLRSSSTLWSGPRAATFGAVISSLNKPDWQASLISSVGVSSASAVFMADTLRLPSAACQYESPTLESLRMPCVPITTTTRSSQSDFDCRLSMPEVIASRFA